VLRFILIITLFLALPHLYLAARVIRPLTVSQRAKRALYALLAAAFLLGPLSFAVGRDATGPAVLVLRYLTWTYLAFFSVLFAFTLLRDIGFMVVQAVGALRRRMNPEAAPVDHARRAFLTASSSLVAVGASGLLTGAGTVQARLGPAVKQVEVRIPNLPAAFDGFHIVQISDVHVGMTIDAEFITPVVDQVLALQPDMIAATGDFVDGSVLNLAQDVAPLGRLRAPDGVFFVTGNHEYYSGAEEWCAEFTRLGMRVLENEHVVLTRDGEQLVVAGITDYSTRGERGAKASSPRNASLGAPAGRSQDPARPSATQRVRRGGRRLRPAAVGAHARRSVLPVEPVRGPGPPGVQGPRRGGRHAGLREPGHLLLGPPVRTLVPPEITSLRLRRA
jgi:hypothetical protein